MMPVKRGVASLFGMLVATHAVVRHSRKNERAYLRFRNH